MERIIDENIYYKEDKPHYIYIHTCPNYWTYVGMSQNPKQRWNNGAGYKENKEFYNAIKQFGWNNIKHEIVSETNYRWIAQRIERTLITYFKKKKRSFNENNIERVLLESKSPRSIPIKKVAQYNKETGEKIKEFDSIREARDYTRVPEQGIRATCLGKNKTSGGFIWKYI